MTDVGCLEQEASMASRLAELIQSRIGNNREWRSLRDAADAIGISKTALSNILTNPDVEPQIDTVRKIAACFSLPLWVVYANLLNVDLGLEQEPSDSRFHRLAALAQVSPDLDAIIELLLAFKPADYHRVRWALHVLQHSTQTDKGVDGETDTHSDR
jgi:transcriptional regulator with XRE-family HTH domain